MLAYGIVFLAGLGVGVTFAVAIRAKADKAWDKVHAKLEEIDLRLHNSGR